MEYHIDYTYKEIDKISWRELSHFSLDNWNLYPEFVPGVTYLYTFCFGSDECDDIALCFKSDDDEPFYNACDKLTVLNGIDGESTSLYYEKVKSIIANNKQSNYDIVQGTFYIDKDSSECNYTDNCLDILNLLKPFGWGWFFIPSLIFKQIQKDLNERKFYINAIFGRAIDESQHHPIDKQFVLPKHCKYLALVISKTPTNSLYVQPDCTFEGSDDDYEYFSEFYRNKLNTTKEEDIYKLISAGNPVIVNRENFIDLNHFYLTTEICARKNEAGFAKFPFRKLGDISSVYQGRWWRHTRELISYFERFKAGLDFDIKQCTFLIGVLEDLADRDTFYPLDISNFDPNKKKEHDEQLIISDFVRCFRSALDKSQSNKTEIMLELPKELKEISRVLPIVVDKSFKYKPNEIIFLPIGSPPGSYHENVDEGVIFFLISCDPTIVTPEYVLLFLSTHLGRISAQLAVSTFDSDDSWKNIEIPTPSLSEQVNIISAISKIDLLDEKINTLRNTLIASPTNTNEVNSTLDEWLAKLDMLSESDQIRHIIQQGESDCIEFKESFSLDVRRTNNDKSYTPNKAPSMEQAVLKTVAGFVNANGGILLIGVSDSGDLLGVDNEVNIFHKNNNDKFLLHFKNLFTSRIGPAFYDFVKYKIIPIDNKNILRVDCKSSPKLPCWLDDKDFYCRTNPSTEKLEGSELMEYIKNHFK